MFKSYKQLVNMIIDARTDAALGEAESEIARSFEHNKISFNDYMQLFDLTIRLSSFS